MPRVPTEKDFEILLQDAENQVSWMRSKRKERSCF